jgi:transcriptional regulator with XRE-family HTH domain
MQENEMAALGAVVRRARSRRNWTQQDLADAAGVAEGTVGRVENGKPVRAGNLSDVLEAVGVQPLDSQPARVDDDIDLAVDIIRKWLEAVPAGERGLRVRELTRFVYLRD